MQEYFAADRAVIPTPSKAELALADSQRRRLEHCRLCAPREAVQNVAESASRLRWLRAQTLSTRASAISAKVAKQIANARFVQEELTFAQSQTSVPVVLLERPVESTADAVRE